MMGYRRNKNEVVSFAALVLGCIMCMLGAIAPYWQDGKASYSSLTSHQHPNTSDDVSLQGGLWWYCYEKPDGGSRCDIYPAGENEGADWAVRLCVFINVILTLFSSLAAMCRIFCQSVGRTICQGIMAFIAGCFGFAVVGLFAYLSDGGYAMPLDGVTFDWAFYVYTVGCSLVTVTSAQLCFVHQLQ
ncbi:unnamed protein product [Lymnaea stagnalis]|uniref:Claudin n=1 Tax=Lymnaea stagnalis TaxID=6523 RepID=A0AAV2ICC6_LYMST